MSKIVSLMLLFLSYTALSQDFFAQRYRNRLLAVRLGTKLASILLLIIACSSSVRAGTGSFYQGEDRYRGFYWFEDGRGEAKEVDTLDFHYPTAEEARKLVAARRKAMDDARSQMVELGFRKDTPLHILREAVVKYKKLEAQMYESTLRLVAASEEASLTNPEIADVMNFPTNVFANKLKRKVEAQAKAAIIKAFANKFDFVLFANSDCPYSTAFIPVVINFAREHGFTLEITSLNSKAGKIAQKLGITEVPTLVASAKDGSRLFELARGLQPASELEASVVTANNLTLENSQGFKIRQNRR